MEKERKSRTSITLSKGIWDVAKAECARRKEATGKSTSFSVLVEEALTAYLHQGDAE